MIRVSASLYEFPWSHAVPDQQRKLSENSTENTLEFFGTPLVRVPKDANPMLVQKMVPLPKLGPPLTKEAGQLHEAPHGFLSRSSSPNIELVFKKEGPYQHFSFYCNGVISQGSAKKDKSTEDDRSAKLQSLILSWIDKMNEIIYFSGEKDVSDTRFSRPWEDIEEIMFKDMASSEPRMSLIVRIAQQLRQEVAEIARHPRRILLRTRLMHRMDRIQEVDSTCLRWLVRQPGYSIPQKAGVKQELLAVIREETFDTLENRVLKDFLLRCQYAAIEYLDDQEKFSNSIRFRTVKSFKELCKNVLKDSPIAEVQPIKKMVKPNHVLQNDYRYRNIWHWYQKLLRQEQEFDEAWTWQSRLWSDIVRILVAIACTGKSFIGININVIGGSGARFRSEQNCGSWLYPDSMPGPFYFAYDNMNYVIEFIDAYQAKDHKTCSKMGAIGGHFYALITNIVNKKQILIVFWSVHGAGAKQIAPIKKLAEMASEGLQNNYTLLNTEFHKVPIMSGCILLSSLKDIQKPESSLYEAKNTTIQTILLPSRPEKWPTALEYIQTFFIYVLDLLK